MRGSEREVTVAAKLRLLERPESYPEPTVSVRVVETHMSWVFLTDKLVYKMKKPVRLAFLDFSTLESRRWACEESLRLNRRLAASVYLGVVPLTLEPDGTLRLGGTGTVVEWLEKMRRLPRDRMLDVAISRGTVRDRDVQRVASVLSGFYRQASAVPMTLPELEARLRKAVDDDVRALGAPDLAYDRRRLDGLADGQHRFVDVEHDLLDERLRAGRVIEAHGDLRPEHVCLLSEPVIIDCLEFNRDFRIMDVADELSYLAMECELAGNTRIGEVLFQVYAQETEDHIPRRLIEFYTTYRAMVRAKLALWHLPDYPRETHEAWLKQARAYLALAERHARTMSA